ncbi:MAG TPA: hypothetical protein VER11_23520 [Polyangiaceae bacterium]|nr:hypothetical protein [Polyangiaceae bacterium]
MGIGWVGQVAIAIWACAVTVACGNAVNTNEPASACVGGSAGNDDSTTGRAGDSMVVAAAGAIGVTAGSTMPTANGVPRCAGVKAVALANAAKGTSYAIALDEDAVYFSGPGGMISRVSKSGGNVLALQRGDSAGQLAVDATNVYVGGYALWSVPKLGGEASLVVDSTVVGLVSVNSWLYFTDWGVLRTGLQRWSSEGGFEQIERFGSELNASFLLADSDYIYVTAMATSPALELHRVRVSDGTTEPLTTAEVVRGIALAGDYLYLSEEATHSVKRVRLSDRVTEPVLSFNDYPTGLAADAEFVYLSLQVLPTGEHDYQGHLLRFRGDGSELCELAAPANYGQSLVVDATGIYWIGDGTLWKIAR